MSKKLVKTTCALACTLALAFSSVSEAAWLGTMAGCVRQQKTDNSWGTNYPVHMAIYDGYHLNQLYKREYNGRFAEDELFVLVDWPRGPHTILELRNKPNLSTVPVNLQDLEGNTWQVSRTWRRCTSRRNPF